MSQADLITQLISLCSSDSATRQRVYALYGHADNACRHVEDAAFLQGFPTGKHALHSMTTCIQFTPPRVSQGSALYVKWDAWTTFVLRVNSDCECC